MRRILRISAIVFCLVLLICAGIGDARYNDNGVNSVYLARGVNLSPTGDVVFIGETHLNFSQFAAYRNQYDQLRLENADTDAENKRFISLLSLNLNDVSSKDLVQGTYYLYNSSSCTFNKNIGYVYFVNPATVFSQISFFVRSGDDGIGPVNAGNTEIPALSQICYMITGDNSGKKEIQKVMTDLIAAAEALPGWKAFDFYLSVGDKASSDKAILRSVTNLTGDTYTFSKNNLLYAESKSDYSGFFTYSDINNRGSHSFPLTVEITFSICGDKTAKVGLEGLSQLHSLGENGFSKSLVVTQNVLDRWDYSISPDPISITEGGFVDLTLTGIPYQTYQLYVVPTDSRIYLGSKMPEDDERNMVTIFTTRSSFSVMDTENLTLHAAEGINDNNQYALVVNLVDPSNYNREIYSKVFPITVGENKHMPTLTLSDDVKSGQFSVGDIIRVSWGYEGKPFVNGSNVEQGNLYLEGENHPKENLTKNNPITFTDPVKVLYLDTTGLDAGSYTLSLVGAEHTAEVAFYLNTPLLTASLSGGSQATFVQGSKLQINWNARGSPYANYTSTVETTGRILSSLSPDMYDGELQWYIFGTNYAAADNSLFTLIRGLTGADVPNGEGKYVYPRLYTKSLDPGTYYVIVQHPGADKFFSLAPDFMIDDPSLDNFIYPVPLSYVNTYSSSTHEITGTLNVAGKQAANAAEMILSYLDSSNSDDLYVQLQFQVEAPWFTITKLDGGKVGDSLSLSGETNYPGGEKVSLTISPKSFTPQDAENSQMQMTAYYESDIVDTGVYNLRTFAINGISTANWYPGTYSGTFKIQDTNEDGDVIKTMTFVVGDNGIITTPDITLSAIPTSASTPVATQKATAQSTMDPTPTASSTGKSPNPIAGLIVGLAAAAYGVSKSRR